MIGMIVCVQGTGIKKLIDGVFIEKGEEMRVGEGLWALLLQITIPDAEYQRRERQNIVKNVNTFSDHVKDLPTNEYFSEERRKYFRTRMNLIKMNDTLNFNMGTLLSDPLLRTKRGVIDLVGSGLSWAFGVATEGQVQALQEQINHAKQQGQAVQHNVEQLITVVRQGELERRNTRRQLARLEKAHNEFVEADMRRWEHFNNNLVQLQMLERVMAGLLDVDLALRREIRQIQHLHDIIRRGQLNEEVCPRVLIDGIVRRAATLGLRPLPHEWYYEHFTVQPLFMVGSEITYQVDLSFVGTGLYVRYAIRTHPIPINGTELRIVAEEDIATHTTEGYWFVPKDCMGHRPQVCQTGPLYKDGFRCERGLLTGHAPDRMQCPIQSCRGQRQIQDTLAEGAYLVEVGQCTLFGDRWKLVGSVHQYVHAAAQKEPVRIDPLNLTVIRNNNNDIDSSSFIVDVQTAYPDIDVNFVTMGNDIYVEGIVGHHLSWTTTGVVIIIIIIIIVFGVWTWNRREKINFFFRDASSRLRTKNKLTHVAEFSKQGLPENIRGSVDSIGNVEDTLNDEK